MTAQPKNGVLLAGGWGGLNVDIAMVGHGITITAKEASARYRHTVYPIRSTNSNFGIEIAFVSYAEYERFTKWMEGFIRALAEGSALPMRVVCPARNFDQIGVPLGIPLGDTHGRFVYRVTLDFTSSEDPAGFTAEGVFSQAYGTNVDPDVNFMLPYGYQMTVWDPGSYVPPPLPVLPENPQAVVATPNFAG